MYIHFYLWLFKRHLEGPVVENDIMDLTLPHMNQIDSKRLVYKHSLYMTEDRVSSTQISIKERKEEVARNKIIQTIISF